MKSYIFITNEGSTFQPNSESQIPDIENLQVIGFGKGKSVQKEFNDMLTSQEYLFETTFNEIIALELKGEKKKYFYLTDYNPSIES